MEITSVKLRALYSGSDRLRALVSVTFDNELAVHDIKVVEGKERLFVSMPSREADGRHLDIVHPINQAFRDKLEKAVLRAYHLHD